MRMKVSRFVRAQQGQGMVEYILIVALIALVAIVGIKLFGGKLSQLFTNKANQIEQETGGQANP
jgi:pilus assembly protein Flp/PilA